MNIFNGELYMQSHRHHQSFLEGYCLVSKVNTLNGHIEINMHVIVLPNGNPTGSHTIG